MAPLIRPPRLLPGEPTALILPASPPRAGLLAAGARRLEQAGYRVSLGPNARRRCGYLAGTDAERRRDLQWAFGEPAIKAVFCGRGGYGVSRVLESLPPALLRRHPKIVVGFSDITLLHLALQKAGLVSFWGPMPAASTGLTPYALQWLRKALEGGKPLGRIQLKGPVIRPGRAEGRLTGGTLTLLAASLGTPYAVETRDRIVFLEDVGEEPYRVDRMLTQLLAAGRLRDAAGIVLGRFVDCKPRNRSYRPSQSLAEVFADRLGPLKLPVVSGLPLGHIANQVTLPYGVKARLDANRGILDIVETAVV
ncbi:MAG: LD-carboxypeptidase [candidate division FCPU426 bacterium]